MYPLTTTDRAIQSAYDALGVGASVSLKTVARAVGVMWRYAPAETSSSIDQRRIILDTRLPLLDQREDFGHELAHILIHVGSQGLLPDLFIDLQERQANNLSLYLLVPSHLLHPRLEELRPRIEQEAICDIAQHFEVTVPFAKRRWRKLQARLDAERQERELMAVLESSPQYGRDYDSRLTIGSTEYFYRNGGVVFQRRSVQE
ncbi:MAG: ImmA/IrrE family metallo-endopeptidase [Bacilli bacterium]